MIFAHKYDEKSGILLLDLSKATLEVNVSTMDVKYDSGEKQRSFDYPGEYEVDGYNIYIIPVADTKVVCLTQDKTLLVLPNLPATELLKLTSELNFDLINTVDILVLVDVKSPELDKKLVQIIEPRAVVKIGGVQSDKDIVLEKFHIKQITMPEDSTNTYYFAK